MEIMDATIRRLRHARLIVTPLDAGRWRIRGRGVYGVLAAQGRWPEDPAGPLLYISSAARWDRMANAPCAPVPATHAGLRRLLRAVRGGA